ncbi:MAG: hypothetical protein FWH48_03440 [Oscillospiraceae bacterium]|nr:hypothetical protein [Oscillospiraceae bacterium]
MLLFAIFALSPVNIAACSGKDKPGDSPSPENQGNGADAANANEQEAEPEDYFEARKRIADNLPEQDFGGQDIKIMMHDAYTHFVLAEEIFGEVVNDAVYEANLAVSERFGANLKCVEENEVTMINVMKKTVQSGDDTYHIAFGHDLLTPPLSFEGYFANYYDMEYLDFDKPWWNKSAVEDFTILNQCYVTVSSMSYMGIARARVLLLNEDKMRDLGLKLPYDEVIDGKWTVEKLILITKDTYRDLNGDGVANDDDFYGYLSENECYGYLDNFDIAIMGQNSEGLVELSLKVDKMTALVDKLADWFGTTNDARMAGSNNLRCVEFAEGKSLFQRGQLFEALNALLGSDINYGILPMPKYDDNQKDYITSSGEFVMVVPSTIVGEELTRLSIIVEAMSAEGYKKIFPAYFKIALQTKYFDNQSIQMLDIINEGRKPSFSFVYDSGIGMVYALNNMLNTKPPSRDFVSFFEKRENQILKQIDKINSAFEKMQP